MCISLGGCNYCDVDTIISEDESRVGGRELGVRHFDCMSARFFMLEVGDV
jgi:hypothetical protein